MRSLAIGLLLAVSLGGTSALAAPYVKPTGKIILFEPTDSRADNGLPTVAPGEQFGVNCGCMGSADEDVRVVLQLTPGDNQLPTGYLKLLATDQRVEHGALRVRVPDAPGLSNHTVDVQVYVVDASGTHACNAGKMKIS